jgi:hypothetical protein
MIAMATVFRDLLGSPSGAKPRTDRLEADSVALPASRKSGSHARQVRPIQQSIV